MSTIKSPILLVIIMTGFLLTDAAKAQGFRDRLKKKNQDAQTEETSEESTASEDEPEEVTKFYADIAYDDNYREGEKKRFGDIYNFGGSGSSSEFAGYDQVTAPERLSKSKSLAKIKTDFPDLKYRRNSIYTLMVHNAERRHWNVIANAFGNSAIPEKYNDHNVGPYLVESNVDRKEIAGEIDKFLRENDIAKKLVARWFNRSKAGGFNMDLIAERGYYNASELDVKIARGTTRGDALLADAGEELLNNTFVIVNNYQFLSAEEATRIMQESVAALNEKVPGGAKTLGLGKKNKGLGAVPGGELASAAGELLKGYVVLSTSYLYQLDWSDSVAGVFYEQYWNEDASIDAAKKEAFESSTAFKLKSIGYQTDFEIIPGFLSGKSYPELIGIATQKATDKAMAKLQRNYEQFKIKTPLFGTEPLMAKVGKKEGLEKNDKFEVLEQMIDENGRTSYNRKAVITVDKDNIWDNRYFANEEAEAKGEEAQTIEGTYFKGSANGLYPGMLIRQIK